ncbi:MAG: AAA family ATPase [bacterium]|nr:AAA family ATPase [bacterium]
MADLPLDDIHALEQKLNNTTLPAELREQAQHALDRLVRMASSGVYGMEYERVARLIDWTTSLPWNVVSQDIFDLPHARAVLDEHHYGLTNVKEKILEYLSVLILRRKTGDVGAIRTPSLLFTGLVGTGKTSLAESIASALGRKLGRIPFGGLGTAAYVRGVPRAIGGGEPGYLMKVLRRVRSKNPVILLDEIDRVSGESRPDLMGVLVEILDPEQNRGFVDAYIDYPFDLSQILFIATANNTTNISPAVLDRLEVIQMPSYTDEEKTEIAKLHLLPRAVRDAGLSSSSVQIDETVWPTIVRPLGFDAGLRTLERSIQTMTRRMAKLMVEGKAQTFHVNAENLRTYLPA